jgi:hypothetical protein
MAIWMGLVGGLTLAMLGYGDREKQVNRDECVHADQLAVDMRRRVGTLREILEDDIVMYGRYPKHWYVPRLVSRTHQPLIREAGDQAARNLESLARRMKTAGCGNAL